MLDVEQTVCRFYGMAGLVKMLLLIALTTLTLTATVVAMVLVFEVVG